MASNVSTCIGELNSACKVDLLWLDPEQAMFPCAPP